MQSKMLYQKHYWITHILFVDIVWATFLKTENGIRIEIDGMKMFAWFM